MKKIIVAGLYFLFIGLKVRGQDCAPVNLGTKTLYQKSAAPLTKPPAGYLPFFINHIGRHGARHLTKEVASNFAYRMLMTADSIHALKEDGYHLFKLLQKLDMAERGNIKSISAIGIEEQQGIAGRMFAQNKTLFRAGIVPKVRITKEVRTKQTADAFLEALKRNTESDGKINYEIADTILRFYDLSPAYLQFEKNGWQKIWPDKKTEWLPDTLIQNIFSRFFNTGFTQTLSLNEKEAFVTELYGFYTIVPSVSRELQQAGIALTQDSLRQFFSCSQLMALSKTDEAEDYLLKGPGVNREGIQVKIAAPLLADFVKTTDKLVKGGNPGLQLRFSHAETIAPFAALLGLQGADSAIKNNSVFGEDIWDASQVVPLSANIQWVFYRKLKNNDCLVKFLLNEKEVRITGLPAATFPYYNWKKVRKFYMEKLDRLQLSLNGDYYSYLQKLQ